MVQKTSDEIMTDYLRESEDPGAPGILTLVILRARRVAFSAREGHGTRLDYVGKDAADDELAALNLSAWWTMAEIGGTYTHLIRSGEEFWAASCVWI